MNRRTAFQLAGVAVLTAALALPVFAAKPSSPPGQAKEKVPSVPITLTGMIEIPASADGEVRYTITENGTTYELEAGPRWFFGDSYPLDPYVGDSVTVVGELAEGTNKVDVLTIDGVAIRGEGKPPWAGGWRRVGESHPGWSQEKADRFREKFGDCFPPGQCKDKSGKPGKPEAPDGPGEPHVPQPPQATDAPEASDEPDVTTAPEVTEAPVITDGPQDTEAPASPEGSTAS